MQFYSSFSQARKLTPRRLIFWIHLCIGLALAIWASLIGLTGSVVVFQDEITRSQFMRFEGASETRVEALLDGPDGVVMQAMRQFPNWLPITLTFPNEYCPFFMTYLIRGNEGVEVYANARTGEIVGTLNPKGGWLGTLHGWHVSLWGGRSGRLANGYASMALLILAITGVILWLPKKPWRLRWREVHFSTGVTAAAFLLMFAIYFVWTGFFVREVGDRFGRRIEPALHQNLDAVVARLDEMAAAAERADRNAAIHRLQIVFDPNIPVRVTMRRASPTKFHLVDTVFLDPTGPSVLRIDRYEDRPPGESILAWFSVLHFAAFGGIGSEIAWSIIGLSFPVLSITGTVMWWRRIAGRIS